MSANALASDSVNFNVDQEHGGLRFAVLMTFLVTWIFTFVVVSILLSADGPALLGVLLGFAAAYGVTFVVERWLKRRWSSGRSVRVDNMGVQVLDHGNVKASVLSEDPVIVHRWRFTIAKRARIPKGWSMLACALEYEGQYLSVYTFMKPDVVDAYKDLGTFTKLEPKKRRTLNDDDREDLHLAGEQRRIREAESARWMSGVEMTSEDFTTYIDTLTARYPEWMSTS